MAIKKTQQGFALLIAIIFMSVMLSFGLTLGALAYKQQILTSNAVESQYAFYAADAGLECALYADQQKNLFDYATHGADAPAPQLITTVACGPTDSTRLFYSPGTNGATLVESERLSLDGGTHCADVTIYKYNAPQGVKGITTYIFSQGYNVSCTSVEANISGARFVSRGLDAKY